MTTTMTKIKDNIMQRVTLCRLGGARILARARAPDETTMILLIDYTSFKHGNPSQPKLAFKYSRRSGQTGS